MDKCARPECNFSIHEDPQNNGGTHCCKACKINDRHGPNCGKLMPLLATTKKPTTKKPTTKKATTKATTKKPTTKATTRATTINSNVLTLSLVDLSGANYKLDHFLIHSNFTIDISGSNVSNIDISGSDFPGVDISGSDYPDLGSIDIAAFTSYPNSSSIWTTIPGGYNLSIGGNDWVNTLSIKEMVTNGIGINYYFQARSKFNPTTYAYSNVIRIKVL